MKVELVALGRRIVAVAIGVLAMHPAAGADGAGTAPAERVNVYRVEAAAGSLGNLRERFSAPELAVLEKLNRADVQHLARLPQLVVPERWVADERAYSPAPAEYESARALSKLLIVHLPAQIFAAYERGELVRWGPVSSGRAVSPTPSGAVHLNWRSPGRSSTVNPRWYMPWYFNFDNRRGLSLHAYSLPGLPASHECVRLLDRDARWLFEWGEEWTLDARGTTVLRPGTPVFIVGRYAFEVPPPWRSPEWLESPVSLPPVPESLASPPSTRSATSSSDGPLTRHRQSVY